MVSALTLPEEAFLAQFNLGEVSALVRRGRVQAARSALLAHYERQVALWPALPRTYSSPLYALSREELVARAEAILAHRFTLNGWPEVELGRRVDWRYNPTPDPRARWTRDLNRYTWWVLLALAYAQTGDERSLLYPCRDGTDEAVTIEPLAVHGGGGLAFVVTTARGKDYLFLSREAGARRVGPYEVKGVVAGVRTDGKGRVLTRFSWEAR